MGPAKIKSLIAGVIWMLLLPLPVFAQQNAAEPVTVPEVRYPLPREATQLRVEREREKLTAGLALRESPPTGEPQKSGAFDAHLLDMQGKVTETLEGLVDYVNIVSFTGPAFNMAGTQSGLVLEVRVPETLWFGGTPPPIDVTGRLGDFEADRTLDDVLWLPLVRIAFLR